MSAPTALFDGSAVDRHLALPALLDALREAMAAYALPGSIAARRAHSAVSGSAPHSIMLVFPGLIPGVPAYTVKFNAKLPHHKPSVRGLIGLIDLETGAPLAVMDSIRITAVRTAAVGAIAADALARRTASTVAVIGAGVQGFEQVRLLHHVRAITEVRVYDVMADRAASLAARLSELSECSVTSVPTVAAAARNADIIITATWAREAFLDIGDVSPGAHITAVGADEPGKAELTPALIGASRFVVDDADLALEMGALANSGLGRDAIHGNLGDVLAGRCQGRTSDSQITVFGSVGLPCQDLAAAWMVYTAGRGETTAFNFHS